MREARGGVRAGPRRDDRARDAAKLPVGIGFQDTHADTTSQLKRRLLDGELGDIKHATVYACWPREDAYYGRASWAGAMKRNGVWVLDSPANNAISHFIMWPLFVMGPTMSEAAVPQRIEAELYRAGRASNASTRSACGRTWGAGGRCWC